MKTNAYWALPVYHVLKDQNFKKMCENIFQTEKQRRTSPEEQSKDPETLLSQSVNQYVAKNYNQQFFCLINTQFL